MKIRIYFLFLIFIKYDLHYNIIKHCKRPFKDVYEQRNTLISNWNSKITNNDIVYILGDVGFYKTENEFYEFFNNLNGKEKHLIFGNHDKFIRKNKKIWNIFSSLSDYKEIYITDEDCHNKRQFIVLSHYAFLVWNKSHHSSWNLHGHSHGTLIYPFESNQYDVGVDNNNFYPISYLEIKEIIKNKKVFKND